MHNPFTNATQQSPLPVPVHLIRPVLQAELQAEINEHLVKDDPYCVSNSH